VARQKRKTPDNEVVLGFSWRPRKPRAEGRSPGVRGGGHYWNYWNNYLCGLDHFHWFFVCSFNAAGAGANAFAVNSGIL